MSMTDDLDAVRVTHNDAAKWFEINQGDQRAVLEYSLSRASGVMTLTHTGVPKELEGKGIGGALVRAALDYARLQGLRVAPQCPFARSYMEAHPEYADLIRVGRSASSPTFRA